MIPLIGRKGAIRWRAGEGLGDDSFINGFVDRIVDAADNFVEFSTLRDGVITAPPGLPAAGR